jgi:hypothetical protein
MISPVHIGGLFATQCHHKRTAYPLSGQALCVAVVPVRADRAFFEMIGLVLSDAVAIVRADLTLKEKPFSLQTRHQFLQYLTDLATSATKEVQDFRGRFLWCFLF